LNFDFHVYQKSSNKLTQSSMKTIDFKITKVTLNDNLSLKLDTGSLVVIVGPNNSGKTTLLNEIEYKLEKPDSENYNLKKIDTNITEVDFSVLEEHFLKDLNLKKVKDYGFQKFVGFETTVNVPFSKEKTQIKGDIISAFVLFVDTITRLNVIKPTSTISITKDSLTHPFHYLLRYENLEQQLSDYVREIFDFDIILHPYAGQKIYLLIGNKPDLNKTQTRYETVQKYDNMDELEDQGDGVKAYVGVLLTLIASNQKVILIDEPENFLHPPQANKLGKLIGSYSQTKDKQLFITTHSTNFLKGILESNHPNLQILRITKSHKINVLENMLCKDIWNEDPILKSSNLLDGLFHDAVIICESDVDVKFYSLILDQIGKNTKDILFVASYGKEKMAKMQLVLNKLNVENKCIVDFDAIADKNFIQNLCSVHNIDFNSLKPIYEPIFQFLKDKDKEDIKRAGKQILSSGIQVQYDNLHTILCDNNIFLVENGELERFVKTKTGKSGKWLSEVLKDFDTLMVKHELDEATSFMNEILRSINKTFN
jgi:AAA15 family ATPase/GTPase